MHKTIYHRIENICFVKCSLVLISGYMCGTQIHSFPPLSVCSCPRFNLYNMLVLLWRCGLVNVMHSVSCKEHLWWGRSLQKLQFWFNQTLEIFAYTDCPSILSSPTHKVLYNNFANWDCFLIDCNIK